MGNQRQYRSIFALLIFLALINLPNILLIYKGNYEFVQGVFKKIYFFLFSYALLLVLASILRTKYFAYTAIALSPILASEVFAVLLTGESISIHLLSTTVDSNLAEIIELLKNSPWPFVAAVIYFVGLLLLSQKIINQGISIQKNDRKAILLLSSVFLLFNIARISYSEISNIEFESTFDSKIKYASDANLKRIASVVPWSSSKAIYLQFKLAREKEILNLESKSQSYSAKRHNGENVNLVVIIGESSRKSNYSLFGYSRKSNPRLELRENLILFDNAYASSNITKLALPIILTSAGVENFAQNYSEKGIIEAFNQSGFESYWIRTQKYNDEANLFRFEMQAKHRFNLLSNNYTDYLKDSEILKCLDSVELDSLKSNFLLLHSIGSHSKYEFRYEKQFEVFKPVAHGEYADFNLIENREQLINAYDNSIVMTDYFIDRVIEYFKQKKQKSIVIYISDHGENLYDNGSNRILHGQRRPNKYELEIPIIMWYSNEFEKYFPDKISKLKQNCNKLLSHENIFHTLLELADISSPYYKSEHSILSENFKEREIKIYSTQGEVLSLKELIDE